MQPSSILSESTIAFLTCCYPLPTSWVTRPQNLILTGPGIELGVKERHVAESTPRISCLKEAAYLQMSAVCTERNRPSPMARLAILIACVPSCACVYSPREVDLNIQNVLNSLADYPGFYRKKKPVGTRRGLCRRCPVRDSPPGSLGVSICFPISWECQMVHRV